MPARHSLCLATATVSSVPSLLLSGAPDVVSSVSAHAACVAETPATVCVPSALRALLIGAVTDVWGQAPTQHFQIASPSPAVLC